jgi:dipeptidyl aminopeptidase/acylaminoacyl peptidase
LKSIFAAFAAGAAALAPFSTAWAGWFDSNDDLTEPFLKRPAYIDARLSPDGNHLATIRVDALGHRTVVIKDLENGSSVSLFNPKRAVFVGAPRLQLLEGQPVSLAWMSDEQIAVNYNQDLGQAFRMNGVPTMRFVSYRGMMRADGESVLSAIVTGDEHEGIKRYRLDEREPKSLGLRIPATTLLDWRLDATGSIRIARTLDTRDAANPRVMTWYREGEDSAWHRIDDRTSFDESFVPLAPAGRVGHILVQARNGRDKLAIWDFDIQSAAFTSIFFGDVDADVVRGESSTNGDGVESVVVNGLRRRSAWLDPRMAAVQAEVDRQLPGCVNILQPSRKTRVLVRSYSDRQPERLYLLDPAKMKLESELLQYEDINPARMQPMQTLTYSSFDGMQIPAYLTLPGKPTKPVPMVVLIHGGPQVRDAWEWNPEVQVFAAHGYAVFQPQFRGSEGFGKLLEDAGDGQWGLAMQDDITAGVRHLIDEKIADPSRICIVGASYGGYAALWGLIKTPALYKCGVSVAGVSDIERRLHDDSDSSKSPWAREWMRRHIGDPTTMAITWGSVSPLLHADRIEAPLLLVHGDADVRVPISHGRLMRDAMKAAHKDVEWLEFPGEGHNRFAPEDERRYYEAVFKLLARTIGKGEPPR